MIVFSSLFRLSLSKQSKRLRNYVERKNKTMKLKQKGLSQLAIILSIALVVLAVPTLTAAQGGTVSSCAANTYTGGTYVAVGDMNMPQRSRVTSLSVTFNGAVSTVNPCNADTPTRTKILFELKRDLGMSGPVSLELPQSDTTDWLLLSNYLRQAQATNTRIPVLKLFVAGGNGQTPYQIELENVLISSYSISSNPGGTLPVHSISLSFTKITFINVGMGAGS